MANKRIKLIVLFSAVFAVLFLTLAALPVPRTYSLLDVAFWSLMVLVTMGFEGETSSTMISPLDTVALVITLVLDPPLAMVVVAIFCFSSAIWRNPRHRWSTEILNHLNYGISTGAAGLVYVLAWRITPLERNSIGALLITVLMMSAFYIANMLSVMFMAMRLKGIKPGAFLKDSAAGLPLFQLLAAPLAHVAALLYVQPIIGDWGGWAILLILAPIFYALYRITSVMYELQITTHRLKSHDQSLQALAEDLPIGVYRVRWDGQMLHANQAMANILGYDNVDELLKLNSHTFYRHPRERATFLEERGDGVLSVEHELVTRTGETIWVRDTGRIYTDANGNPDYISGTLEDISTRKKIEAELALTNNLIKRAKQEWEVTVDSLPHFICLLNADKRVLRSNRMVEAWGLETVTGINGRLIHEVLADFRYDGSLEDLFDTAWANLEKDEPFTCEVQHRHSGQVAVLHVRPLVLDSFRTDSPRDSYAVLAMQDITEAKNMEAQLIQLNTELEARVLERTAQLEAVNRQLQQEINERARMAEDLRIALIHEKELSAFRSRFSTMISHEFRTPLTVIQTSIDLLDLYADRVDETKRREFMERMRRQIKHLVTLLEDIMTISRAETVGIEINRANISLAALVDDLQQDMKQVVKPRHTLTFEVDHLPPTAYLDAKLVHQMVSNLVSNATKYSPHNTAVRLQIGTEDDHLVFKVSDSGIGIPPEAQPHLFDVFYRADNVGAVSGTGLGLAIVKLVVDLHDGRIDVHSQPGNGTTFVIHLPLVEQQSTESVQV
ncbi:MAG: ATP-binding protein [Chloroflexota bacterium]